MFAVDTNMSFSNCDIPVLFAIVNSELIKSKIGSLLINSLLMSQKQSIHFSIKLVKKMT